MSHKPPAKHRSHSQPPSLLKSKTAVIAGVAAATALAYKIASSSEAEHGEDIRAARDNAKERFKNKVYGEKREFEGPARPREHASDTYHGLKEYLKDQVLGEEREFGNQKRAKQRWEMEVEAEEEADRQQTQEQDERRLYSDRYSEKDVEDDFENDQSWRRRLDRAESRPGWEDVERSHRAPGGGRSRRSRDDYDDYEEYDESDTYDSRSGDYDHYSSRGRDNRGSPYRRGSVEVPRDYFDRPGSTAYGRPSQRSRSLVSPPTDWPADDASLNRATSRRPEDITSEDRIFRARKERGLPVKEEDGSRREEKEKKKRKHKTKGSKDARDKIGGTKDYPFVEPVAEEKTYIWDGKKARPEEVVYYLDRKS